MSRSPDQYSKFGVQVTAYMYDIKNDMTARPGGLAVGFDTEAEMWEFIRLVASVSRPTRRWA